MVLAIVLFALFCSAFCLGAEPALWTAAETECTRADLQSRVDEYLDALKNGDSSLMTLFSGAKYIENRKEIPFNQGIWQKALDIDFHRSVLDVESCETFTEIIHASSDHPYVLGTRLKIVDNKIS